MEFCCGKDVSCGRILGFAELFSCLSRLEGYCAFLKEGLEKRSVGSTIQVPPQIFHRTIPGTSFRVSWCV